MNPTEAANHRRRRFDHHEAFAYWAGLGNAERSFVLVAERFGVSDTAVRKVAKADGWAERLASLEAEANRRVDRSVVRSFEERQRDQLRVTEKLRARILTVSDSELDLSTAVRSLPRYAMVERLIAGEATSRIALAELQPLLDAYTARVLELAELARRVDPEAVDGCLARLDDELAALAASASAPSLEPAAA